MTELLNNFRRIVSAPVGTTARAVREVDLSASPLVRTLFLLRGLPTRQLDLDGLERIGFTVVRDEPGGELALGIVGRFWTPSGAIVPVDADRFDAFDVPGHAKVIDRFTVTPRANGSVLEVETTVEPTSPGARRRFRAYWAVVGPFSGLVRREWLRLAAATAEGGSG